MSLRPALVDDSLPLRRAFNMACFGAGRSALILVALFALALAGCGTTDVTRGDRAPAQNDAAGDGSSVDGPEDGASGADGSLGGDGQPGPPVSSSDVLPPRPGMDGVLDGDGAVDVGGSDDSDGFVDFSDGMLDGATQPEVPVAGCFGSDEPGCRDSFEEAYGCVDLSGPWEGDYFVSGDAFVTIGQASIRIRMNGCHASGRLIMNDFACFSSGALVIDQEPNQSITRFLVRPEVEEGQGIFFEAEIESNADRIFAEHTEPMIVGNICDGVRGELSLERVE